MFLAACLPVRRRITDLDCCCGGREGWRNHDPEANASKLTRGSKKLD
jgi:hypothetical protein